MSLIPSVGITDRVPGLPVPLLPNGLKICSICSVKPLLDQGDEQFMSCYIVLLEVMFNDLQIEVMLYSCHLSDYCNIIKSSHGNKSVIVNIT